MSAVGEPSPVLRTKIENVTLDSSPPRGTRLGQGVPSGAPSWQQEVTDRLGEFRRRRARLHESRKAGETLDLDFDSQPLDRDAAEPNQVEFSSPDRPRPRKELASHGASNLDFVVLDHPSRASTAAPSAKRQANRSGTEFSADSGPMEIELEVSPGASGSDVMQSVGVSATAAASLKQRLFAGVIDFLVFALGAAVFGMIFWQAGGHVALDPLDLAVGVCIGVFFVATYFGVFPTFVSATPGMVWAGVEIRTFGGTPPKGRDCFWRAFGYVVSISALMLGFVWALVDAEGLTWHDRMSRTFLVKAGPGQEI